MFWSVPHEKKPHKDTEKQKGMFATFAIALPSIYSGGGLEATLHGRTIIIEPEDTRFSCNYTAFYADCVHEIKPVLSGFRIVLVYNLIYKLINEGQQVPSLRDLPDNVADLAQAWKELPKDTKPLLYVLQHEYTEDSLSFDTLKGADSAKVGALVAASRSAGIGAVELALLDVEEGGMSYDEEYNPRDDHCFRNDNGLHFKGCMTDPLRPHLTTKAFDFDVESSLYPPLSDLDPTTEEKEEEDYYGNAPPTWNRNYRHAVVIIYPQSFVEKPPRPKRALPTKKKPRQSKTPPATSLPDVSSALPVAAAGPLKGRKRSVPAISGLDDQDRTPPAPKRAKKR